MNYIIREELEKVYKESVERNFDTGPCVMGYNLIVYDKQIVSQPFQGVTGCYNVYQDVINFLVGAGLDRKEMYIEPGVID